MRKHIPNIITLGNLVFGCCAIYFVLGGAYQMAVNCLVGCFLCDYADGLVARGLGVSSPLGKELDSLADVVSFGVVPGMFLFSVLFQLQSQSDPNSWQSLLPCLPAFVLTACAALRLGKFNLDTRQTSYFLGLSTPATTILVVGVCMAILKNESAGAWLNQNIVIYALILLLSFLMLSEIKLLGLKINTQKIDANVGLVVCLFAGLFLIFMFGYTGAALSVVLYMVVSMLYFSVKTGASIP